MHCKQLKQESLVVAKLQWTKIEFSILKTNEFSVFVMCQISSSRRFSLLSTSWKNSRDEPFLLSVKAALLCRGC